MYARLLEAASFLRLLRALAPFASCFLAGCGTSPASGFGGGDSGAPLGSVVTTGGGILGSSSPGGPGGTASSGATSSGAGTSSGTSSGVSSSGVSSSGVSSSGMSSGSGSGGATDAGNTIDYPDGAVDCTGYKPPMCGSSACDLRSNTCCVTLTGTARCVAGANAKCNSNEITGHCQYVCDCTGGRVCCGVGNTATQTIATECQDVPDGGHCSPYPQTATTASAQFCGGTAECKNGEPCTMQTCIYNVAIWACGLQAQDPFYCK